MALDDLGRQNRHPRDRHCHFLAEGANSLADLAWVVSGLLIPYYFPVSVDYHDEMASGS